MAQVSGVCNDCYKYCLLRHRGEQDQPQKLATFFKVMFGKRFSELLFVPPKQSGMFTSLVGKTCYLEDSTGHEWEVILSYVEGCLAFKEGWPKFSLDHDIEQGDFLVFHYYMESSFLVTIYGRSGWEKAFSGERTYKKKRAKTTTNFTTKKVPSTSFSEGLELPQEDGYVDAFVVPQPDSNSIFSQGVANNVGNTSIPSRGVVNNVDKSLPVARKVPKAEFIAEPSFLTEKETTLAREDDREHLLDLSAFELPDMKDDKFHLFDLPTFLTTEKTTETGEYHTQHQSYLPSFEYPVINSSFAREGDGEYLFDLPTSNKIDNIADANYVGELQGRKCSQKPGLHGVQAGDASRASTDTYKSQPNQGNTSQPLKNKATLSTSECSPTASVSSALDVPLDSPKPLKTIMKNDNFESSAAESDENEAILSTSECNPTASVSPPFDMPLDSPKPLKTIMKNDNFESSAAEPGYTHPPEDHEASLSASECSPIHSFSPALEIPLDSTIPLKAAEKSDAFEPSAMSGYVQPPGETIRIIKQEREFGQYHFSNLDLSSNKKPKINHVDLDVNWKTLEDDICNREDLGVNLKPMEDDICSREDLGVNVQPMEDNVCNRDDRGVNLKPTDDDVRNLEDLGENLRPMEDDVPFMKTVKSEPVDFCEFEDASTPATASRITCSIPQDNESFLELPEPLPVVKLRQGKKLNQRLILLQDPDGDDWPVIYHDKNGVKVLASGWNAFRRANNISPGDECAFVLQDSDKGMFRVHILRT